MGAMASFAATFVGLIAGCATASSSPRVAPRTWGEAEAMAEKTLGQMTAAERAALLTGVGWAVSPGALQKPHLRADGMYAGNAMPIQRLGVPALKMHYGASGFRTSPFRDGSTESLGTTTAFPSPLALAATWDEGLVARVAEAVGEEFREKGANVLLGPAVQVHRVARGGRNYEFLSGDDPYLGARLSAAYVRGVQGAGVMACAKHFAFYEQELDAATSNFLVDERTAWELYYPPFEAAVKAGAGCVMCARVRVNGTYACHSPKLLETDLKGKMGFRGFVVSDWWASRGAPAGGGLDLEMPGPVGLDSAAAPPPADGQPPPSLPTDLEGPARRILAAIYRLRVEPSCSLGPGCREAIVRDTTGKEHRELALEAAARSVILLKNEGVLPIDPKRVKRLALLGHAIDDPQSHDEGGYPPSDYYSGGGSGHVAAGGALVTPRFGIVERARAAGIDVICRSSGLLGELFNAATQADLVVFVAATSASEGSDRLSMMLDFQADHFINTIAGFKETVVLLQTPGPTWTLWRDHPNVTGIANTFLAGEQTGRAWASVLFGDVTPSGKLPVSFPKLTHGTVEPTPGTVIYAEGLWTSYRRQDAADVAAFPFGHGLSYTTFAYGTLSRLPKERCRGTRRAWEDNSFIAACLGTNVTNVGNLSGAEVAQAYVEFPKEANMPRLMLKGFHRTRVLAPDESELALFAFAARDLSTYDVTFAGWTLQRHVAVHCGASSADLRGSLELSLEEGVEGECVAGGGLESCEL